MPPKIRELIAELERCGFTNRGGDALKVFIELNEAVEEVIQIFKEDGKPLPTPKEVVFETA